MIRSGMLIGNIVVLHSQKQALKVFSKKRVLRNFTKFTGKYLCQR